MTNLFLAVPPIVGMQVFIAVVEWVDGHRAAEVVYGMIGVVWILVLITTEFTLIASNGFLVTIAGLYLDRSSQ